MYVWVSETNVLFFFDLIKISFNQIYFDQILL